MECFMPYFALIIMFYHVKIACYQLAEGIRCDKILGQGDGNIRGVPDDFLYASILT